MPHEYRERKKILVGTQYENECCTCCDVCFEGTWPANSPHGHAGRDGCPNITDHDTNHRCCFHKHGEPDEGQVSYYHSGACPYSCCACPPLGNVCLQLTVKNGAGDTICNAEGQPNGMEFTLTPEFGQVLCRTGNPPNHSNGSWGSEGGVPCYTAGGHGQDPPPHSIIRPDVVTLQYGIQKYDNWYEKWGWSGTICQGLEIGAPWVCTESDGVTPKLTDGEKIKISLCCCDTCNHHVGVTYNEPADCHSCSYRLSIEWEPQEGMDGADSPFCSCPDYDMTSFDRPLTPTCDTVDPAVDCTDAIIDFEFDAGQCASGSVDPTADNFSVNRPFVLEYILPDRWWHCDCCQNGMQAGDDDAFIYATIVDSAAPEIDCGLGDTETPGDHPGDIF